MSGDDEESNAGIGKDDVVKKIVRREARKIAFKDAWGLEYRKALDPSGRLEAIRASPMSLVSVSGVPETFWDMLGDHLYLESSGGPPVCRAVVIHGDVLARKNKLDDNLVSQAVRQLVADGCSVVWADRGGGTRPGMIRANAPDVACPFNAFEIGCRALLGADLGGMGVSVRDGAGEEAALADLVSPDGRVRPCAASEWSAISLGPEMALPVYMTISRAAMLGEIKVASLLCPMAGWGGRGAKLSEVPPDDGPQTLADIPGISAIRLRLDRLAARMRRGAGRNLGVVLYGGPGTGKTMIAKALARESGRGFVLGSVADWQGTGGGHLGSTLAAMKAAFDEARSCQPSLLFIDELDSIGARGAGKDEQYWRVVVNGFLEHVQGARDRGDVVLVAATNDIGAIDPAILRSGRFGEHVRVRDPKRKDTEEILGWYLRQAAGKADIGPGITVEALAVRCLGASPALMKALVEEACALALEESEPMSPAHFLAATRTVAADGADEADPLLDERWILERIARHEAGHALCIRLVYGDDAIIDLATVVPSLSGKGAVIWRMREGCRKVGAHEAMRRGTVSMAGRAAELASGGLDGVLFGAGSDMGKARFYAEALVGHGLSPDSEGDFICGENDAERFSRAVNSWLTTFHDAAARLLAPRAAEADLLTLALLDKGDLDEEAVAGLIGHLPKARHLPVRVRDAEGRSGRRRPGAGAAMPRGLEGAAGVLQSGGPAPGPGARFRAR